MNECVAPNAQGKRRLSPKGAWGTDTGHENGEAMASVGVRLTAQLGIYAPWWFDWSEGIFD